MDDLVLFPYLVTNLIEGLEDGIYNADWKVVMGDHTFLFWVGTRCLLACCCCSCGFGVMDWGCGSEMRLLDGIMGICTCLLAIGERRWYVKEVWEWV